jgi:transposase-like protein
MHTSQTNPYKRHRFPAEIISHCVWLYFRFCLSYRDVEELMAECGIILTYEAVRYWCRKFDKPMPISCGASGPNLETSGIWMRCF